MAKFRFVAPILGIAAAGLIATAPSALAQTEAAPAPQLRAKVAFGPDSATLTAAAAQVLDELALALEGRSGKWVVVVAPSLLLSEEGQRDTAVVVDDERRSLETQRREQVTAFLVAQGVPRAKVVSVEGAADLDPAIERVMLYLEDAAVVDAAVPVDQGESVEKDDEDMSFRPVLPGERRELPSEQSVTEQGAYTPPYYGAGEYVQEQEISSPSEGAFLERVGVGVSVGGGVAGFVDPDTRVFADAGGTWDARVTLGTRMPVAVEASYFGSANGIEALGLDDGAILLGNGFEGDIRIELLPSLPVRPYVVGGFGYTYFRLTNAGANTSSVHDSDGVLHAPLGLGVTVQHGRLLLDVRGLVRAAFDDTMLAEATDETARLSTWGAVAKVGWEL